MAEQQEGEASTSAPSSQWEQTSKGKGKVRPRKAQLASGQPFLPRLTAVAYK